LCSNALHAPAHTSTLALMAPTNAERDAAVRKFAEAVINAVLGLLRAVTETGVKVAVSKDGQTVIIEPDIADEPIP